MSALASLARSLAVSHPEGTAHALEAIDADEAAEVLQELPGDVLAPVVERLSPSVAAALLDRVDAAYARTLLEAMGGRQAALVLHHVDAQRRDTLLQEMPARKARDLIDFLQYPPDTAGGMMEKQVTALKVDFTVEEAISVLRRAPRQTLYYLYVTDREGRLVGVVNMRDLLLADGRAPLAPLVRREVLSIPARMDREDVVTLMRQRKFLALPVVDEEERLLGVVRHEQALAASQQEAFEDLQKLVGAGGDERALSPVSVVVRKRLPWLYVNLLTAFIASAVVGMFADVLAKVTALAVLMPVVSGQGGNSGSQTLAVVVRGIALREILPGAAKRLLLKEVVAALLNGAAVAVVTAIAVFVWSHNAGLALVIGLAMVGTMAIGGLAGASIPLALRALGQDPAQSSSIFLTTVTDVIGFASFLGLATLLYPLLR